MTPGVADLGLKPSRRRNDKRHKIADQPDRQQEQDWPSQQTRPN